MRTYPDRSHLWLVRLRVSSGLQTQSAGIEETSGCLRSHANISDEPVHAVLRDRIACHFLWLLGVVDRVGLGRRSSVEIGGQSMGDGKKREQSKECSIELHGCRLLVTTEKVKTVSYGLDDLAQ